MKETIMPRTQLSREFFPLCHEHHVKMTDNLTPLKDNGGGTQTPTYACTEPDCLLHYNISAGYFMLNRNGNTSELEMVPKISCPHDGVSMYLAEIDPAKRGFRLWRCPQCGATRTNEEGLVA
jgi:hypothetical protein